MCCETPFCSINTLYPHQGHYIKVCQVRPPHPGYPTCGLLCAAVLRKKGGRAATADSLAKNLANLDIRSGGRSSGSTPPPSGILCIVCHKRPKHSQYPTCGLVCAGKLQSSSSQQQTVQGSRQKTRSRQLGSPAVTKITVAPPLPPPQPPKPLANPCVICKQKEVHDDRVTCSALCVQKLATQGGDPQMCDYCHRRERHGSHPQCGTACAAKAKVACLYCRVRQRNGRYHLCGNICRSLSTKKTPLLLEAPRGHETFNMVETKFKTAWRSTSSVCPEIKKVFKIIENNEFLKPYNAYRTLKKNERFRYHGTKRACSVGTGAQKEVCQSQACSACSILKTSFKVRLALTSGAFGPGIYTSSASNKAFSYSGTGGTMLLTKVVLGNVKNVSAWNEVMSCPPGHDSVVFNRQNGTLNETVVYSDDAIRPVFLITF
ncbi:hypothetical protein BKA70DRAFT_1297048 [Coprinopsis sp. MPI-PUGE-AT-0042]|nr:hypothetical protein BKA70DRAFT_1297048 [Coprinopsis sp. MPI-PUGE-AT-0042]